MKEIQQGYLLQSHLCCCHRTPGTGISGSLLTAAAPDIPSMRPARSQDTNQSKACKEWIWSIFQSIIIIGCLIGRSQEKSGQVIETTITCRLKTGVVYCLLLHSPATQVGHRTYLSQPIQQWPTALCLGRFHHARNVTQHRGKLLLRWWQCHSGLTVRVDDVRFHTWALCHPSGCSRLDGTSALNCDRCHFKWKRVSFGTECFPSMCLWMLSSMPLLCLFTCILHKHC